MSTIAEFRVSAAATSLGDTFDRVPDVKFELEPSVSQTPPCLWVVGPRQSVIESAFDEDPSVGAYTLLLQGSGRLLYDVSFTDELPCLSMETLGESGSCSLLELWGYDGWWQATIRVQHRDDLWRIHERLIRDDCTVDLRRVSDVTDTEQPEPRLTPEQHEALEAALELGYFEIPREISMEELAGELEISHQALSERLRRAYETLVDGELQPRGERADPKERAALT